MSIESRPGTDSIQVYLHTNSQENMQSCKVSPVRSTIFGLSYNIRSGVSSFPSHAPLNIAQVNLTLPTPIASQDQIGWYNQSDSGKTTGGGDVWGVQLAGCCKHAVGECDDGDKVGGADDEAAGALQLELLESSTELILAYTADIAGDGLIVGIAEYGAEVEQCLGKLENTPKSGQRRSNTGITGIRLVILMFKSNGTRNDILHYEIMRLCDSAF
jgi:hypothetical protein